MKIERTYTFTLTHGEAGALKTILGTITDTRLIEIGVDMTQREVLRELWAVLPDPEEE